jgi:hypothetical protein
MTVEDFQAIENAKVLKKENEVFLRGIRSLDTVQFYATLKQTHEAVFSKAVKPLHH